MSTRKPVFNFMGWMDRVADFMMEPREKCITRLLFPRHFLGLAILMQFQEDGPSFISSGTAEMLAAGLGFTGFKKSDVKDVLIEVCHAILMESSYGMAYVERPLELIQNIVNDKHMTVEKPGVFCEQWQVKFVGELV